MKKQKRIILWKHIKKAFLMLMTTTLIFSCKQDYEKHNPYNEHFGTTPKYNSQDISFSIVEKDSEVFSLFQDKIVVTKDKSVARSSMKNFNYINHIDQSKVVQFQSKEVVTYTFPVVTSLPKSDGEFFNLIIKKYSNKRYAAVIKYTPDNKNFTSENLEDFSGKIAFFNSKGEKLSTGRILKKSENQRTSTYAGRSGCTPGIEPVYKQCDCKGRADGHPPSGAPCCNGSQLIGYDITICIGGGSNNDNNNNNNNSIDFGPLPNVNGSGGSGGATPTTPIGVTDALNFQNKFLQYGISLTLEENEWGYGNLDQIKKFLNLLKAQNGNISAKNYVKGQMELNGKYSKNTLKLKYKPGKINNRNDQKYTHIATDGKFTYYRMEDGSSVVESDHILHLNKDGNLVSRFTSETGNSKYWYIKTPGTKLWSNYLFKENSNLSDDLRYLFKAGATDLLVGIGTYVIPVEDIKILFTGKDFAGQPTSRWLAAGMLLVEIVPGGKLVKAVKLIPANSSTWKIIVKEGNKIYTRTVKALSKEASDAFKKYAVSGVKDLVDLGLRNGEHLDNIAEEVAETLRDAYIKKGNKKLSLAEIFARLRRGKKFDKKGRVKYGGDNCEIVLENKKRLDTYIHGEKIISRKATDIDNILESTWRKYCVELVTKYKKGLLTKSKKLKTQVRLDGKYYIEIPLSNQTASNLQRFKDIAKEYDIEIIFLKE